MKNVQCETCGAVISEIPDSGGFFHYGEILALAATKEEAERSRREWWHYPPKAKGAELLFTLWCREFERAIMGDKPPRKLRVETPRRRRYKKREKPKIIKRVFPWATDYDDDCPF